MALPAGYLDKSLVEDVRDGKSLLIGDLSKVGPPDDDIYIMMSVCVSVCHEKSSLPLTGSVKTNTLWLSIRSSENMNKPV